MDPNNKRLLLIIVFIALLAGDVFFGFSYFNQRKELRELRASQSGGGVNEKVFNFYEMFIKKVLQAENEVDFETRLSLENAVRELKDAEIMAAWQEFTASQTEIAAQNAVKKLLGILIDKIQR